MSWQELIFLQKLPASDILRYPHPFRDATIARALTRSFLRAIVLQPCRPFLNGLGLPIRAIKLLIQLYNISYSQSIIVNYALAVNLNNVNRFLA